MGKFVQRVACRSAGWAVVAGAMTLAVAAARCRAEPVRVMTFNIRYGTADDGPDRWERRRELLLDVIREFNPDVLGVQEALRDQLDALAAALPEHGCVGVGREADGSGEYSAVFYRRTRFDLLAADTFWLSASPDEPGSRTWGNTLPRICTWARLVERADGRRFTVFNTHWDHQSQPARVESGALMAARIAARRAAGDPVLAMGDFNAAETNPAIRALIQQGELQDTYRAMHSDAQAGATFHGFTGRGQGGKIDFLFATKDWRVAAADIVRTERDGRYPSDHFPVTAIVELEPSDSQSAR